MTNNPPGREKTLKKKIKYLKNQVYNAIVNESYGIAVIKFYYLIPANKKAYIALCAIEGTCKPGRTQHENVCSIVLEILIAAVLPIFKGCKFSDGDGEKFSIQR